MNPITEIEAAVATGGWSVYLKLAWKLLPWIIGLGLFAALLVTRATLHNVRQNDKLAAAETASAIAENKAAWALQGKTAADNYATALATRQPLIVKSTDTVREYAQTPAGRALCATADRVQGIDALDASLFAPAATSGPSAVPANSGTSTGGRVSK